MATKNIFTGLIFLVAIFGFNNQGLNAAKAQADLKSNFKITGYLLRTDIEAGNASAFDFSRITDLNIAFINPDKNGNISNISSLNQVISSAHSKNVKVFASIGGGLAPAYFSDLLSAPEHSDFIRKLVQLTTDYNLDGIDVDLEGPRIDSNYESFVTELSIMLKQHRKLLTAAVATAYMSSYTDKALAQFDFINIMSYDKTGPWRPADPGQHAPYDMAVSDLDYWTNTRGIAKEKLGLGLPFYGYGFGQDAPSEMSFNKIINNYPDAANADSVIVAGGGVIYYNGDATIKAKTKLALQKAGGIMIWQLLQDADGPNSLLNSVNSIILANK